MQDCSNSIANGLELLQSCTEPSTYGFHLEGYTPNNKDPLNGLVQEFANALELHLSCTNP